MAGARFSKGERVRVYDEFGIAVAEGIALQDRDYFGWAQFQVDCTEPGTEWVDIRAFNLNFVRVEVL